MSVRSMPLLLLAVIVAWTAIVGAQTPPASTSALDEAFDAFWTGDPAARAGAAERIVHSGITFEQAWTRLEHGRRYRAQPTGLLHVPTQVGAVAVDNLVTIPASYVPDRTWPLRVQLHGRVGRDDPESPLTSQASRIAGEPQIIIEPHAYWEAAWWHTPQVENIESLLAWVRQRYNVDEARTYVTGISDGGTGVYFQALREPNRWAVCAPLNGHPLVLSNRDARIDGNLYLGNLASCPLYIVNGDRDPLYPAASVAPVVAAMRAAGAVPVFLIKMNAAHDTRWWPEERASYEAFLHAHPRAAHPDRVTWETDRVDRFNRARWLVIDALGSRPTDRTLPDVNRATDPDGTSVAIFPRRRQVPSGRADVVRIGNRFEVETRGVAQFTLLVSPSVIDFSRSVEVVVNGRRVFEGSLTRDLAALMRWAARDDDRTQLYGAELHVQVP